MQLAFPSSFSCINSTHHRKMEFFLLIETQLAKNETHHSVVVVCFGASENFKF